MELIAKLIILALAHCFDLAVIDWHPDDGIPDSFQGECEIEYSPNRIFPTMPGDYFVILNGVFCIVDAQWLEVWHASKMEASV